MIKHEHAMTRQVFGLPLEHFDPGIYSRFDVSATIDRRLRIVLMTFVTTSPCGGVDSFTSPVHSKAARSSWWT